MAVVAQELEALDGWAVGGSAFLAFRLIGG